MKTEVTKVDDMGIPHIVQDLELRKDNGMLHMRLFNGRYMVLSTRLFDPKWRDQVGPKKERLMDVLWHWAEAFFLNYPWYLEQESLMEHQYRRRHPFNLKHRN